MRQTLITRYLTEQVRYGGIPTRRIDIFKHMQQLGNIKDENFMWMLIDKYPLATQEDIDLWDNKRRKEAK